MKHIFRLALITAIAMLTDWPLTSFAQTAKPGVNVEAELDQLIKAAKAEGEVLFYTGATENVAKRTFDAFTAKYGIKVSFIRIPGVAALRRFSSEAEGGTYAADLFFTSGSAEEFAAESAGKGWIEPVPQAGLPVLKSGEYPVRFMLSNTAIIQVAPWIMAINTQKLARSDAPKEWIDLLNPKFKGQLLLADPRTADAYLDLWSLLIDRYGESYLTRLREQNPRQYAGAVPATNALAAGEGTVQIPGTGQQYQALIDKGAPLAMITPALTSGVEMKVTLTHRTKAKHPNAGRLYANYVMSTEGNKIFNSDPGLYSVYDLSGLPRQYESPKPGVTARRDLIAKLLGFQ